MGAVRVQGELKKLVVSLRMPSTNYYCSGKSFIVGTVLVQVPCNAVAQIDARYSVYAGP